MAKIIESLALFCTRDGSDKEYRVQLMEETDGFMVIGFNGRRGSTLKAQPKTTTPVPLVEAKKVYDTLVKSKLKGGYVPGDCGAGYVPPADVGVPTGISLHLLKEVSESEIDFYINSDEYVAQQKHDGERRPVRRDEKNVIGSNKRGFQASLTQESLKVLLDLPVGTTLDSEHVGDNLFVFDAMEANGKSLRDTPYLTRLSIMADLVDQMGDQSCVVVVETAVGKSAKRALYERLRATRKEGIVFKKIHSKYCSGETDDQIKVKFFQSCTAQVVAIHHTKRSIGVQGLNPDKTMMFLGNVAIPRNKSVPKIGDLVEIEYLYCVRRLVQPFYKGLRTDQTIESCCTSKLKYRDGIGDDDLIDEDPELIAA